MPIRRRKRFDDTMGLTLSVNTRASVKFKLPLTKTKASAPQTNHLTHRTRRIQHSAKAT